MPIRVALHHKTAYRYDRLVSLTPQVIRLRPAPHCRTPIVSYSFKVEPAGHFINWQQDPQSNYLARVVFPEKVREFVIEVGLVAEMAIINPFDFFLEDYAQQFPFEYADSQRKELAPYREAQTAGPRLDRYLAAISLAPTRTIDFLVGLNQRLQGEIRYEIRMEPGVQTCEQTLTRAAGSCRDTAWLLVQICRRLGLAARFVSGYLIQLKPDVKPLEGPPGPGHDFTDLHAWAEVYLPGAGWVGLDATSGLLAGEGHIPLAAAPEPYSAAPVSGGVEACESQFLHEMSVTRIHEDPRVTLPYTDAQWERIEALGYHVDSEIRTHDIRLTMGGEPSFVSVDDMEGAQWSTEALGPEKRVLAERLIDRLRRRFAPGALLHFGQGKWYPGEPLPRWALACYWRKDGKPLWRDDSLLMRHGQDSAQDPARKSCFGPPEAQRFAETLTRRLGLDPGYIIPAYEDPLYYTQKERQLPVNVDTEASQLEDEQESKRLRQVFKRGLDEPCGFVLPLQRDSERENGPEWQTSLWMLRGERLFAVPGDSPLGLRLPLSSLPWVAPEDEPETIPADPMAEHGPLPVPTYVSPGEPVMLVEPDLSRDRKPKLGESATWIVRKALCVQPRDGRLYVFMPPLTTAEDYLDLLAAVEDTASYLGMPLVLEGYTPPADPRINVLKVTPDPGVIEVNIHPAHDWPELVSIITTLYEEAHQTRLGTEKFMIDGRHSGTGGGNHFVLGGATPADSPFLRRPHLLRSMIAYWLHHPALSYMFSGMFIGPTSQAPRVDETRQDSLYELDIAFRQVPGPGEEHCSPWLVDRIFRHLLVDVAGNTHRAEFCIDKLYSPDTSSGRLGLLELRGFEMPPHARMSLTQQLLVRALVAWFWKQPYTHPPAVWGTALHDRFMLPHFIELDFAGVLEDLNRAGFPFEPEWFAPHLEFRYPVFGRVNYLGVDLELRQATEPWYVLGEETTAGAMSRYVDSSVERVQVKVSGMFGDRYVVACNGRRVPLHSTGTQGEWVAGVRYRAWQPPSCLHPTIPVHSPLAFELIDTWTGRSVGGCSYHVAHPGGLNYVTFPVNANEAECRRGARFVPFGSTAGPAPIPAQEENPQFPLTLDLRR